MTDAKKMMQVESDAGPEGPQGRHSRIEDRQSRSRRPRWAVPIAVLAAVAILILAGLLILRSPQTSNPIIPPIFYQPPSCAGTIAVRLYNGDSYSSAIYHLIVTYLTSSTIHGTLDPGENVDYTFNAACGTYTVYVSWNDGIWHSDTIVVESGLTSPVYFSY